MGTPSLRQLPSRCFEAHFCRAQATVKVEKPKQSRGPNPSFSLFWSQRVKINLSLFNSHIHVAGGGVVAVIAGVKLALVGTERGTAEGRVLARSG